MGFQLPSCRSKVETTGVGQLSMRYEAALICGPFNLPFSAGTVPACLADIHVNRMDREATIFHQ
jgi:hypothetical protein